MRASSASKRIIVRPKSSRLAMAWWRLPARSRLTSAKAMKARRVGALPTSVSESAYIIDWIRSGSSRHEAVRGRRAFALFAFNRNGGAGPLKFQKIPYANTAA